MADGRGAFSFVDRITDFVPRTRARGGCTVPTAPAAWSPCLTAEAVGQLAAWMAMAAAEFRRRPVAALAGAVAIFDDVTPGAALDLEVEIEECGSDTVVYNGQASAGGRRILALKQCVGPMLPMEDFDDPRLVAERFEILRSVGAECSTAGDDFFVRPCRVLEHQPGLRMGAGIDIPQAAAFFADHFPRKPIFPATLLLDAQIRLARDLAGEAVDPGERSSLRPTRVHAVKVRSFVAPGQPIEIVAEVISANRTTAVLGLTATSGARRIATARVEFGQWRP